ncbi:MAG TPA: gliding motility-associated C-terminal domain-containing protein [Bacteroidales bacterium]|nr:gliding motility-associated C-terminal domain-containing protein [Bacteroidales bacterium]HOU94997.1 gliding motility-associated C-terminal domain-containing protein [Bacteroidales bacterium]HQG35698.1 gliding motility-associated C-terminal domain-containing protein [Bacteroidales bacterium]HQJ19752.1 gliding motility-associated C-terminal domain-containing protein [Bacteroidales bacterium]
MRKKSLLTLLAFFTGFVHVAYSQKDDKPPLAPVLINVSVQPETGFTEIYWNKSTSPDVAGYVLYYFINNGSFAFDTIYNPQAEFYINKDSKANFWSESYCLAAIDSSGNVSPLSNPLSTIFTLSEADTCKRNLNITWNNYFIFPLNVKEYKIKISENGSNFREAGKVAPEYTSFTITNIEPEIYYCVIIEAVLDRGFYSSSNKTCKSITMQRVPKWINANYATVNDNRQIELLFSIDPLAETWNYTVERKEENDTAFQSLNNITTGDKNINFTDITANCTKRFTYRLAALNSCGIRSAYSNIASNITSEIIYSNNVIKICWNPYSEWRGGIMTQELWADFGGGFEKFTELSPYDSSYSINYSEIMYRLTGSQICFYLVAEEWPDSLGFSGRSKSNIVCMDIEEKIFVPNTFTPDNDNINDLFRPVFSFTPVSYLLIITDRENKKLFESNNFNDSWDGSDSGSPLPTGVYLWYLKVKTPSGKMIQKNGTITILRKR